MDDIMREFYKVFHAFTHRARQMHSSIGVGTYNLMWTQDRISIQVNKMNENGRTHEFVFVYTTRNGWRGHMGDHIIRNRDYSDPLNALNLLNDNTPYIVQLDEPIMKLSDIVDSITIDRFTYISIVFMVSHETKEYHITCTVHSQDMSTIVFDQIVDFPE